MKFEELKISEKQLQEKYSIIKADEEKICAYCGVPTKYIDYCFEQRVCSTECQDKLDKKYNEIIKRMK